MRRSKLKTFTIFDVMDANGYFSKNPANADSFDEVSGESLYTGPVEFPKMLYHPKGEFKQNKGSYETVGGEKVMVFVGGVQHELKSLTVKNDEELKRALGIGWKEHPSDSIAAGFTPAQIAAGLKPPPKSSATRISELEATIERLKKELAASQAQPGSIAASESPLDPFMVEAAKEEAELEDAE